MSHAPRRRRGLAAGGVVLAALIGVGAYVPAALAAPLDEVVPVAASWTPPQPDADPLDFPLVGASAIGAVGWAAPGADAATTGGGRALASSGTTDAVPIASISKVITALVVLDARPLAAGEAGPLITLSAADAALYGAYLRVNGKVVPSPAGLVLTERQMLEVTLVTSANNYADSLAAWAFGSRDGYLAATSAWLADNGLTGTTIVEPTGMSPDNRSTTSDLIALGELALADPVVAAIVAQPSVTVPTIGDLANSNTLLGIDSIDGIKTGTLDQAGACLLFSADLTVGEEQITVIGVVLGGADRDSLNSAVRALLDDVQRGFREVPVVAEGEVFGRYETEWGARSSAVASDSASVVVWGDTAVTSDVTLEPLDGDELDRPAAPAGRVVVTAGERTVEVPLVLGSVLAAPDGWWRITHPGDLFKG